MRTSLHRLRAPGRRSAACVCSLAVALLWSPLWVQAWHSNGTDCCSGAFCPIHGHRPEHQVHSTDSTPPQSPMDCEHHHDNNETHGQRTDCSMSCCHGSSPNLTGAVIFVLPELMLLSLPTRATDEPADLTPMPLASSLKPPSPPPRTL